MEKNMKKNIYIELSHSAVQQKLNTIVTQLNFNKINFLKVTFLGLSMMCFIYQKLMRLWEIFDLSY